MKFSFKYLLVSLFLFPTLISFSQSQEFLIQKYSVDNGLPDNRVNDIVQDSTGRIWAALKTGIAMYDGVEWKKYEEKDSVPEIEYVKIKIDEKGVIWFLPILWGNHFLIYYDNSNWKKFELPNIEMERGQGLRLTSFDIRNNNSLKIYITSTVYGVICYENNKIERLTSATGLSSDSTTNVIFSNNNNIYISSAKGLSVIDENNVITNYDFSNYHIDPFVLTMTEYRSSGFKQSKLYLLGKNWIGEFENRRFTLLNNKVALLYSGIIDLFSINVHTSGELLFSGPARAYSYNIKTNLFNQIIFDSPETNTGANSIFVDYEGNIWFAGLRGIYKCRYSAFKNYSKQDGLLENEVSAISEFNGGDLVFGHNYGLTIKTGSGYKYIRIAPHKLDARQIRVLNIFHDSQSDIIYYVSYHYGIGRLLNSGQLGWLKVPSADSYYAFLVNNDNGVYVSTNKGIYEIEKNRLIQIVPKILNFPFFRTGLYHNDSTAYLASAVGLFKWMHKANTAKKIRIENFADNDFYSLFYNKKYGLLAGSVNGLYKLEKDSLKKYSFNGQGINESVYFIIEDKTKNIWLGTNNGVLKWDGKNIKRYNKSDGLSGNETNRAAGFVDSKGNIWIGTDEGLSLYTGKEFDYSEIKPKLLLLGIEDERDKSYDISKNINFDPDDNSLTFNYRGLTFIDESQNVYEVRLSEVSGSWSNSFITKYAYSRFNNLQPGDYIFSVRVKNSKDIWSDWKTSSIITINKHYYQQPLFIIGNLFIALFILYYFYNYLQQRKYTHRLEEAIESRTKLLKEKQVELVTSLERYKGIVDSQSDLVVRVDANNKFTFVNDAYCKVFGKSNEELLGNSFYPLIHPEDRESTFESMEKLKLPPHRVSMQQRAMTVNGYRWLLWEDYAIFDEHGNLKEVQGVGRDITLQKEIEAELEKRVRERTIELKSLVSQSPFGILTFNEDGFLIDFNYSANNLFGNLKDYILPKGAFNIYEDDFLLKNNYKDRLINLNTTKGVLITGRILIDSAANLLYRKLYSRYLIYRIYAVEYEDKSKNLILLLEDVTDIQKTEETNKKLSEEKIRITTFIQTVETERERIAKELHDGIGQLLTTAKLKLDIFKLKENADKSEIDDALNTLLNAGDEIRRIINDLRPYDIDKFGLISAIEILCDRIKQASGLNIQFFSTGFDGFSDKKKENITYRIIQEALNNIVKHSYCKNASINIVGTEKYLNIEIWDDGIGFNEEGNKAGFGIFNMKERAILLNGEIKFSTTLGEGVKIVLVIPRKNND